MVTINLLAARESMRYQENIEPVYTEGMKQTSRMTIAGSGKAFRTLIDSMYSEKIRSPIREKMSNALDSHIAAGVPDLPFEVTLPTALNPIFRVRDFGTGMTHEQVMGRYSILFDSTKDGLVTEDVVVLDPDSQTGSLGLGSKSFFSYTDNLVLTCFDGTTRRDYSIHMTQSQEPDISLMSETPCNKARGVAVQYSVSRQDLGRFEHALYQNLLGYDVLPNIYPKSKNLTREQLKKVTHAGPLGKFPWEIVESDYLNRGIYAKQGSVLYQVDLNTLFENSVPEEYLELSRSSSVILNFPIGSVNYVPSREGLEYTRKTMSSVKEALEELKADVVESTKKKWESLKTDYEKDLYYNEVCNDPMSYRSPLMIISWLKAQGADKLSRQLKDRWNTLLPNSVAMDRYSYYTTASSPLPDGYRNSILIQRKSERTQRVLRVGRNTPISRCIIVVDDENSDRTVSQRSYVRRIREFLNQQYLKEKQPPHSKDFAYFIPHLTPKLHKLLGEPKIYKLSAMPLPKVLKSSGVQTYERDRKFSVHGPKGGQWWESTELPTVTRNRIFVYRRAGRTYQGIRSTELLNSHQYGVVRESLKERGWSVVEIRIRSNENLRAFRNLPSLDTARERFLSSISTEELRDIVYLRNAEEFKSRSVFNAALSRYSPKFLPKEILDMRRHEIRELRILEKYQRSALKNPDEFKRYDTMPIRIRTFLATLVRGGVEWQKIVTRALNEEIEVIPYLLPDQGLPKRLFRIRRRLAEIDNMQYNKNPSDDLAERIKKILE